MRPALLVFAKEPIPGRVKTRLTPDLSEEDAARLYAAFLEDQLARYVLLDVDVRLYVSGRMDDDAVVVPDDVAWFCQRGEGLGIRMLNAFADTFTDGYGRVAIVGSDHPTLPPAFIEHAFETLLDAQSVVIGPAEDGGYYLLGMNDLRPSVFSGLTYGHARVFDEALSRIRSTTATLTVMPLWYDVDTPDTLRRLARELREDPDSAPRTRDVLRKLTPEYPWIGG